MSAHFRKCWVFGCALLVAATLGYAQSAESGQPPASGTKTQQHSGKTSAHKKSHKTASSRKRGQQKIDAQRATEIQSALIREHYMTGKSSGTWDGATEQAMQKYQADNGWQSKSTPDARALIKLGLGPDHEHLLNPESAMTSPPAPTHNPSGSAPTAPPSSASQPQR